MGLRPLTTMLATAALATVTATAASAADAQPATRAASPATALQVTGVGCAANMELTGQTTTRKEVVRRRVGARSPHA